MSKGPNWIRSSYSGDQGEYVEAALLWTKASHSSGEGECVEVVLPWTKSSHSGGEGECVEVARTPATVHVRDSKDPEGPAFRVAPGTWSAFLAHATTA
ncbi:hypothetical protein SALBM135S_09537 [Streptomyces alboniger]